MSKPRWVSVAASKGDAGCVVTCVDSAGRGFIGSFGAPWAKLTRLPDPPPLEVEAPTPRQPITEWPGPGEEPAGLWVLERSGIVGVLRGRFVLVPDSNRALWACSGYSLRSGDFEDADRFIPVED